MEVLQDDRPSSGDRQRQRWEGSQAYQAYQLDWDVARGDPPAYREDHRLELVAASLRSVPPW